jgi:hypothetical protein
LPSGSSEVQVPGGLRFRLTTRGLLPLARLLVGYGDLVRVETPELRTLVRELAKDALRALEAPEIAGQLELLRPS